MGWEYCVIGIWVFRMYMLRELECPPLTSINFCDVEIGDLNPHCYSTDSWILAWWFLIVLEVVELWLLNYLAKNILKKIGAEFCCLITYCCKS